MMNRVVVGQGWWGHDEQGGGGAGLEGGMMNSLEHCMKEGHWLVIQNCHLAPECSLTVERLISRLSVTSSDINSGFRLWLTTSTPTSLSSCVLGASIKLAVETPDLLRDQVQDYFTSQVGPAYLENNKAREPAILSKMAYSLVFLVAQCNKRNNYVARGWAGTPAFTETDLEVVLEFKLLLVIIAIT